MDPPCTQPQIASPATVAVRYSAGSTATAGEDEAAPAQPPPPPLPQPPPPQPQTQPSTGGGGGGDDRPSDPGDVAGDIGDADADSGSVTADSQSLDGDVQTNGGDGGHSSDAVSPSTTEVKQEKGKETRLRESESSSSSSSSSSPPSSESDDESSETKSSESEEESCSAADRRFTSVALEHVRTITASELAAVHAYAKKAQVLNEAAAKKHKFALAAVKLPGINVSRLKGTGCVLDVLEQTWQSAVHGLQDIKFYVFPRQGGMGAQLAHRGAFALVSCNGRRCLGCFSRIARNVTSKCTPFLIRIYPRVDQCRNDAGGAPESIGNATCVVRSDDVRKIDRAADQRDIRIVTVFPESEIDADDDHGDGGKGAIVVLSDWMAAGDYDAKTGRTAQSYSCFQVPDASHPVEREAALNKAYITRCRGVVASDSVADPIPDISGGSSSRIPGLDVSDDASSDASSDDASETEEKGSGTQDEEGEGEGEEERQMKKKEQPGKNKRRQATPATSSLSLPASAKPLKKQGDGAKQQPGGETAEQQRRRIRAQKEPSDDDDDDVCKCEEGSGSQQRHPPRRKRLFATPNDPASSSVPSKKRRCASGATGYGGGASSSHTPPSSVAAPRDRIIGVLMNDLRRDLSQVSDRLELLRSVGAPAALTGGVLGHLAAMMQLLGPR
jgi:hypothetical protein